MRREVLDTFSIRGRGTVVMFKGTTELPVGKPLTATIQRPDGSALEAEAYKEWLSRSPADEIEFFCFSGLKKLDIPLGSLVDLRLAIKG